MPSGPGGPAIPSGPGPAMPAGTGPSMPTGPSGPGMPANTSGPAMPSGPSGPAMPPAPPPPPPGTTPPRDPASYHQSEQTRTYPCPSCGDQLAFDPRTQSLTCRSCGRTVAITAPEGQIEAHELGAAMARIRQSADQQMATLLGTAKEVVCQNCGGRTRFEGTVTATRCPYCASVIARNDIQDAPARLPADGVIPMQVDEKTARTMIDKWINSRWFAPTEFKKYREVGAFTSLYASYFVYDAESTTEYRGQRGIEYTVSVGSGDNEHLETRVNWYPVSGVVQNTFDDVPALANTGFDTQRVRELEPWPTEHALPYTPEYMAGHATRTYDLDAEQAFGEARSQMEPVVDNTIRADIGGDRQQINWRDIRFDTIAFKYLLLPMWLLTVVYEGRPFQVFINGVTGEVQGQRPWSKVKIIAASVAITVLILAIVILIQVARK